MATNSTPDNVLFDWYERFFGEPDSEFDVYLGFGLFFLGVGLAVIALVGFVAGVAIHGYRQGEYFTFVMWSGAIGLASVPLILSSITVLLPVDSKVLIGSAVGSVISFVGAGWFWVAYPSQWAEFGSTTMLSVVGSYALGLAIIVASTGTALVAQQLQRAQAPAPSEIEASAEEEDIEEESYSEEEIRSDIEQAMEDVDIGWGGVEKTENKRLEFTSDFETDVDRSAFDNIEAKKTIQDGGVDSQVSGLKQMKGGEKKTATSNSTVDDQTAALKELKKQKERDEVPDDAPTPDKGLFGGLLSKLGLD